MCTYVYRAKEMLNGLEDELSKKQEELKKTRDEHERSKSKWKDKESNYKSQYCVSCLCMHVSQITNTAYST